MRQDKRQIQQLANDCINCNVCVKNCKFLETYATPGELCANYLTGELAHDILFKCNLCGLCDTICLQDLNISRTFLAIRRQEQKAEKQICAHKRIMNYEDSGHSSLLTLYKIPANSSVIFFPGCTLSATKSKITEKTYKHLSRFIPDLGIVLDCCHKPSHDLGKTERFHNRFSVIVNRLRSEGIKKIITACPSCLVTFQQYAPDFTIGTVYEELAVNPPANICQQDEEMVIHDSCVTRHNGQLQDSVRQLTKLAGITITEVPHAREKTICCGEGASAMLVSPKLTKYWQTLRKQESGSKRVITYCAGCSATFHKRINSNHLLDLIFDGRASNAHKEQQTRTPFTWLRRIQLKHRLKRTSEEQRLFSIKLIIFIALLGAISACRILGLDQYLNVNSSKELLYLLHELSPLMYIALLTIVPVLFLPAFPVVVAAGLLYDPSAGFLYAMLGASSGASISFLLSRYLGNKWFNNFIQKRINSKKWDRSQQQINQHGWKMILILRLIPLFPFTPLNYALGLTNIRFSHYLAATVIGILPGCASFILFSSSLWDILQGNGITMFLFAFFLLVFIIIIQTAVKKQLYARKW